MKKGSKPNKNTKENNSKVEARMNAERLSDRAVLISALAILYGILLLFLQNMGYSIATASGAVTFVSILFWASIVGAMLFAALSVYREQRGLLLYSGIFIYVLWTTAIIRFTGNWAQAFAIVYVSLFSAFILFHVNIWLRTTGRFEKKSVRIIFKTVAVVILVLLTLCSIGLRTGILNGLLAG